MVIITSDSTADLDQLFVERDIDVMPLFVDLEGVQYLDGITIKPDKIFEVYEQKKVLPKTASRSIDSYKEFFEAHTKDGKQVIHFTISESMSSSYANAESAAKFFGGNVTVIDSRSLSTGIGLLVLKAKDFADAGMAYEEIISRIKGLIPKVQASFIVDTMEYLHKGGRCNGLTRYVTAALSVKPSIYLKDGEMKVGSIYMGSFAKNVIKYVKATLAKNKNPDYTRVFITHTYAPDECVESVRRYLEENCSFKDIFCTHAGCTVTAHCGKGTLGILFINDAQEEA